jgi:hypothetical protein
MIWVASSLGGLMAFMCVSGILGAWSVRRSARPERTTLLSYVRQVYGELAEHSLRENMILLLGTLSGLVVICILIGATTWVGHGFYRAVAPDGNLVLALCTILIVSLSSVKYLHTFWSLVRVLWR